MEWLDLAIKIFLGLVTSIATIFGLGKILGSHLENMKVRRKMLDDAVVDVETLKSNQKQVEAEMSSMRDHVVNIDKKVDKVRAESREDYKNITDRLDQIYNHLVNAK